MPFFRQNPTAEAANPKHREFASLLPEDVRLLQQADCMLLAVGGEGKHREECKED